jgi:KaiC/GvpD/RAD55 family RecA-like ATPase
VSAAQALQDLEGDNSRFIPTRLAALDASLSPGLHGVEHGGIQKGHVTDIWGPPGVGKTAFGYEYACTFQGR